MKQEPLTERMRETLALFEEAGDPWTTPEVAERLDLERRTAYARLERLVEQGRLETKSVGASARVWWRPTTNTEIIVEDRSATTESLVDDVLDDVEVGIVVINEDFDVAWVNEATERYFGLNRERVIGQDNRQLVNEQITSAVTDSDSFAESVLATYDDNTYTEQFECRVTASEEHEERLLEHRSKPVESGEYAGGRVELYYDITDLKQSERARQEGPEEFKQLVDAVEEYAIFTLDTEGCVQTWNPGAERIKGYAGEDILGEHFSAFYTAEDCADGVPDQNLARAANRGSIEDEGWRVRADGSRFWANVTITPIRDADGELDGYAKVTRDMTDRKRAETERELLYGTTRAIAESETFEDGLETALHTVCETTDWEYAEAWIPTDDGKLRRAGAEYVWEGITEFGAFSEEFTFDQGEGLPGRVWATGEFEWAVELSAGTHEEYPRLEEALNAGLQSAFGVPIIADDEVVAVLTFLMRERREVNERLVKTVSSVASELGKLVVRRQLEAQMERERDLVEQILDTSPVGIMVLDRDGEPTRINERAMDLLGIPDDQVESYTPADWTTYDVDGNRVSPDEHPAARVLETGEPVFDWQARVEIPDGDHRWLSVNAAPIFGAGGTVEQVITTGKGITQLKKQAQHLERQRDDIKSEIDDIFTRIDEAFFALDEDWRITHVNDRAAELVQLPVGELMQARVWDVLPEVAEGHPRELAERALETQESVEFEFYSDILDIWMEIRGYPSETGMSVYIRDITDRKERERALEESQQRYRTLVENFPNGAVALVDEDLCYRTVGGTPLEEASATIDDLEGSPLRESLPPALADVLIPRYEDALDGDASTFEDEVGERSYQFHILPVRDADGTIFAAMGVSQDITDRKEREQELELYETIVDTVEDGIYVLDEDFCFLQVNDAYVEVTGYDREELLGTHCSLVVSDDVSTESLEQTQQIAEEDDGSAIIEADVHRADGSRLRAESRFTAFPSDDGALQKVGIVRDVSERVAREQELRNRVRQQDVVADLGQRALEEPDLDVLLANASELVADTLDNDYCKVLDLDSDTEELLLRHGVGWNDGIVGEATVSAVEDDSQAAITLATEQPVVLEDLTTESRFSGPDLLTSHNVRSGISTIIGPADDSWGILGTHDTECKEFSEQDATFVQAVANILAAAIDRHNHEQELVHQREQLAALNSLNEVIRDITSAVIEQSSRDEIEATVCERLAESESYSFAWTGGVETASQTVTLRTEAGVEGVLGGITMSVDPDDERSDGPTGTALRTGEIQVVNDTHTDSRHDPWRWDIEEYGLRSSAAIPIVHEDTVYGVLNIYAERPDAFTGQERNMVAQLGEIVGHAIAAAERKRALLSDELVELDFQIQDVFADFDASVELTGTVTFDHTVAVGDGEYLIYGTATPDALDTLAGLVETQPHWESVTVRSEGDPNRFEIRVADPPILSVVASRGGYLDRAVIENGNLLMTIHLAPTVDVREVINTVEEAYPTAEMVRRQQITRDRDDLHHFQRRLMADLTDRQHTALEAAYHAGFFEWPRNTSGEEVADSMGVAPPTFHQHLRKAERKVFDSVFSSPVQSSK